MARIKIVLSMLVVILIIMLLYTPSRACDVAVVAAKASTTGRPFIWKNRDCSANWRQEMQYFDAVNPGPGAYMMVYNFDELAELNNGTPVNPSGGINEAGFATACTSVYEELNLYHEAVNINTDLIRQSLQECITVEDYDDLLQRWHIDHIGHVISGNFVVIDAFGGAALYECYTGDIGGTINPIQYRKHDANTGRIVEYYNGVITVIDEGDGDDFIGFFNRTNANTFIPYNYGEERRWRAEDIMTELATNGKLNYETMMKEVAKDVNGQQLSDDSSEENYSTTYCISRAATRLGMVVDGVEPGGDPRLSVFWCVLGEPSIGVFVPYFLYAREVSYLAWVDGIDLDGNYYDLSETCLLNRASNRRETYDKLLYESNLGDALTGMEDKTINRLELWKVQEWTFPLEDFIIDKCEEYLADMTADPGLRRTDYLRDFSNYTAQYVYDNYNEASSDYYDWDFEKPWGAPWEGYTRGGLDVGDSSTDIPVPESGCGLTGIGCGGVGIGCG